MLQALLATEPDCREVHLIFLLGLETCTATFEIFWSADEPERRYVALDLDIMNVGVLPATEQTA